jgi:hypothetical protein
MKIWKMLQDQLFPTSHSTQVLYFQQILMPRSYLVHLTLPPLLGIFLQHPDQLVMAIDGVGANSSVDVSVKAIPFLW